jgi:hypothetical protein
MTPVVLLLVLAAGDTPPKRPNMPVGWTWPPSASMKAAGAECTQRLDEAEVEYAKGPAVAKISTPVLVDDLVLGRVSLVPRRKAKSYPMDCQLAAAITEVSPALAELGVDKVRFGTLHEYRYVKKNGRTTKILSRHALGLAVDVFAFEMTDGRVLEVERDWAAEPVLTSIAKVFADSPRFRTPLTPANDPDAHGDHVHLEAHMRLGPAK